MVADHATLCGEPVRPGSAVNIPAFAVVVLLSLMLSARAGAESSAPATNSAATGAVLGTSTAKPPSVTGIFDKPAWLTDLGLGIKESYDNNVFMVSGRGAKERDSWITTVSPKFGVNFAPLLGDQLVLQVLAFGYAPEFNTFHNVTSESFTAHRFAQTIKAGSGNVSFSAENGLNYIDGSAVAPIYAPPDDVRSCFATGAPRERREQVQDRMKIVGQYDQDKWFFRPTASLLFYDLHTEFRKITGYQNWPDRYDVNGGADLGYKLVPGLAATLGYRYGHQYQQQLPKAIDSARLSSPNDYQRVLLGLEGKPWKWLTGSIQGGPDFRTYEGNSSDHTSPVHDFHPVKYYGEASLAATLSSNDSITFRYKQWQWLSSVGKLPMFDSLYELAYRRKLGQSLSFDLAGRIQSDDYTSANVATCARDDWQYSVVSGLTWALDANLSANLAYSVDLGRNHQDHLANADFRDFDHHLVSLGAQFKF